METITITGANRGIGLELTRQYLRANNTVIATCRNPSSATDLITLTSNPNLQVAQLDVTDRQSVDAFCASIKDKVIDVLINNAGVKGSANQGLDDMDAESWLAAFNTNTIAPFMFSSRLLKNLKPADDRASSVSPATWAQSVGRAPASMHIAVPRPP